MASLAPLGLALALTASAPATNDTAGWRLIFEAPARPDVWYHTILGLLGGLEISGLYGRAEVASHIATEGEAKTPLAEGDAEQLGWGVGLYNAPRATGFFWQPAVGFLQQRLTISDFRDVIPQVDVPDAVSLEAICRDAETGEKIACGAPNRYQLEMKSGSLGLRGGYAVVAGDETLTLFAAVNAGVNLVEYRSIRAALGRFESATSGWRGPLQSFGAGGTIGVYVPWLHLAVRFIVDWGYYRKFEYDRPLEFKGPTVWDDEREVFYRERSEAKDAQLDAVTLRLATAWVF